MQYSPDIVYSTKDYKQFVIITANREVDEKHVRALMKSIRQKNMLIVNPIIVNSSLEVIEGQHRLESAERLKVPVYFVVSDNITKKDIAALNTNRKNWKPIDYVNFFTVEKQPGYDILSNFINAYPHFPVSTCLKLLSITGQNPGYKNGDINVGNNKKAIEVAEIIKDFRNCYTHAYDRNFILAVVSIINTGIYDHKVMKQKLEYQSRSLVKCVSSQQYTALLEEIYNYRNSSPVRFF